jgi:hypothetical protein
MPTSLPKGQVFVLRASLRNSIVYSLHGPCVAHRNMSSQDPADGFAAWLGEHGDSREVGETWGVRRFADSALVFKGPGTEAPAGTERHVLAAVSMPDMEELRPPTRPGLPSPGG